MNLAQLKSDLETLREEYVQNIINNIPLEDMKPLILAMADVLVKIEMIELRILV